MEIGTPATSSSNIGYTTLLFMYGSRGGAIGDPQKDGSFSNKNTQKSLQPNCKKLANVWKYLL